MMSDATGDSDQMSGVADLQGLHAGLDDGRKHRLALVGVGEHVRDLLQQAAGDGAENRDRDNIRTSDVS